MKRISIIFALLVMALGAAQSQRVIKIWEGIKGFEYKNRLSVSELAIYPAEGDNISDKSVIICPGGSYFFLGLGVEGHDVARVLQKRGFNCFVLRYRVGAFGNHYPAMIRDLQRAIQVVRNPEIVADINEELNLHVKKLGVLGFSSGGHMAAMAATYYDSNYMAPLGVDVAVSLRPDFIGMIYPVVSMQDSLCNDMIRSHLFGANEGNEALKRHLSMELNTHEGMPPVFMVQCEDDDVVKPTNHITLADSLKSKGVPVEFHLYKTGGHGFGLYPNGENPDSKQWLEAFVEWLKKQ